MIQLIHQPVGKSVYPHKMSNVCCQISILFMFVFVLHYYNFHKYYCTYRFWSLCWTAYWGLGNWDGHSLPFSWNLIIDNVHNGFSTNVYQSENSFQGALSTGTNQNANNQSQQRNMTHTLSLSGEVLSPL